MKHLKLFFALFAMLALNVGNAWGAETLYKNALFKIANCTKNSSYTGKVTCTIGDDIWVAQNAANNNGGWDYVKIGAKKSNSSDPTKVTTGTITTDAAYAEAVSKIVVNGKKDRGSFTSKLIIASNSSFTTDKVEITGATSFTNNQIVFEIASPSANKYYKLEFVCSNTTTTNGVIQVSSVEYYYEPSSDEPVVSLTADPTTIDFGTVYEGATVADKTVTVNFENLTGDVTYSGLSTPFTATGAISATGDKITISADASTIGEYSQTLTIASTADSKTAEVTVKMNVVEKPAPTGTFTLHTGELIEGDYVIYYSGKAMKAEVASSRLQYVEVTPSNDEIVDPAAAAIWHIAKSGENWTIYNNDQGYAAGNGTKNQAALVANLTGDNANKAAWIVTASGNAYEFVNVWNKSQSVNANLRNNGTYGFACYATGTGGALSLYRKAGAKYNVTVSSTTNGSVTANPTSAEAGATIALTITPDAGYVLDALTVTDASSNPVTVTDNKFTMPASDVTVTATFKENEKPAATLTLSKNGDTSDKIEGKVGDVINLPTFTSDCSKTFVGWDAKSDCAVAPEYAPGAEYILAAETQTLYAVYANAVEGAPVNIFSETFDACEGKGANNGEAWSGTGIATATLTLEGWTCVKENAANGCAKFGASSAKGSAETPAIAITGNATLSFRAGAWDNASEVTTLNLSATGANLNQSSITLTKAAWTEYTIYITEATGSVKIKFEASVEDKNRFFLDDVVVSQASVTYSNYSTTCTAALDAPIFTPVEGTYNEVTNVTISATDGDVYYTLDGTTPTEESNKYTAPIVLNTNGTTTIKAIAISAESQSSVVTATYTIKLPLTTMDEIFAAATTAGGAEAPVLITMNNWVVTGKTTNNAYVTDGTKGFVIYKEDHGFNVGDILSGTVACNVQLFRGSAELTELTATTEGLSITTGGTVSAVVVDDVTTLSGVNTGSVIKINGVHESDNIVNNVKLYNTLFSFENLTPGQEYNVTGVYLQYDATKEILPRSEADIEKVEGLPTATISIENITLVEGEEHTIVATITPNEAASTVTYSIKSGSEYVSLAGNVITANAIGTATITAAIAEVDGVYHGTTKDFTVTVNEYVAPISGTWELVTDASKLQAGMEVIVAQYVDADGTIYTMGAQNTNNRASVESIVSGTTLTPTTGTVVLTLVDAGNGTFALQAGNGKYLYAASSTSNHLKETATINDNAKWSVSVTEGKASVVAQGSNSRNTIRFNKSNNPKIFSCYATGQQDVALYALVPDHSRTTSAGRYGTICLPGNIVKCLGATLYEVAGKEDNGRVVFDEVLAPEAGMPYIFLSHNAEVLFYCGTETATEAGKHNSLQGTFNQIDQAEDNILVGNYMVVNNVIKKCGANCGMKANRAYFIATELESLGAAPQPMPGRRRVTMGVTGENEATGVDNITENGVIAPKKLIENGQLIIIRDGVKYNVQGVRL